MPTETSKKALAIFFLVFGLVIAVFIVTQGIDMYQSSKGYSDENAVPSIDCIQFFYDVTDISYENGELSFRFTNLDYSADISNITAVGRNLPVQLPRSSSQQIRVGAELTNNFTVYPGSCSIYATTCFLDSGECERSQ